MNERVFHQASAKAAASLLILLLGLSACSPKTSETSVKEMETQTETQTESIPADQSSKSSVKRIPDDVSDEMISFYPYLENRVQNIDYDSTAAATITWSGSTSAAELGVATSMPIWAFMKLAENYPYNPFILLEEAANAHLKEWGPYNTEDSISDSDTEAPALRIYEWKTDHVQSEINRLSSLSAEDASPEYSLANCGKLLEMAGLSAPVYEAEDCLYSYFGSVTMTHFLNCDIAAVYFFPDNSKENIDHVEIQFLYDQTPVALYLEGGWAGSSLSSNMSHDVCLMKLVSLIHVMELTLAGETNMIEYLAPDAEGVPENYAPGNGNSEMKAELHTENASLGVIYHYSLSRE